MLFGVIYPLVVYFSPGTDRVRTPGHSAADGFEAAFGVVGEDGKLPRDLYFDRRVLLERGEESRDTGKRTGKRRLVWAETAKLAGLRDGETVLENWR